MNVNSINVSIIQNGATNSHGDKKQAYLTQRSNLNGGVKKANPDVPRVNVLLPQLNPENTQSL